jgi:ribulose-phosphate 3-epimerase
MDDLDLALVMSVNPGFSGQKFISSTLDKMRQLRHTIENRRLACDLEVDGGVNPDNAQEIVQAGGNILVAATAIFKHPNGIGGGIRSLRQCAENPTMLV